MSSQAFHSGTGTVKRNEEPSRPIFGHDHINQNQSMNEEYETIGEGTDDNNQGVLSSS
jgi:hypothetical protein